MEKLNWVYNKASIGDKFYCIEKFSYVDRYRCEFWENEPEDDEPIWATYGTYEEVKQAAEQHYEQHHEYQEKTSSEAGQ